MKLSMMHKMLLWILLPVLLGLGAVSYMNYREAALAMETQIRNDLQTLLDTQVNELQSVRQTLCGGLRSSTLLIPFRRLALAATDGRPEEEIIPLRKNAVAVAQDLVKSYGVLYGMTLLDASGTVQAHCQPENIGRSYKDRTYFQNAMKNDEVQVQNLISRATGALATVLAVAMKDDDGRRIGVLLMTLDNAALAAMTTSRRHVGQRGHCYVYNLEGEVALHPDKDALGRSDKSLPHVPRILQEGKGRQVLTQNGEQRILYYQPVSGMNWIVVMDVSRDELMIPLREMLRDTIILLTVIILLVGVIIFISVRNVATNIKVFAQIATHIAAGELAFSADEAAVLAAARKRRDELSTLADAFQSMRDNIQRLLEESRHKEQEALQAMQQARQAQSVAEQATQQAENARRDGMQTAAIRLENIVETLSSASTQLAEQIEQVNATSLESSQRLSETASTITQMNITVQQVAEKAGNTAHMTDDMRAKAGSASSVVQQSLTSIDRVHSVTSQLRDDMQRLTKHAQDINHIMGVISDIADQTNLLALNAAIEAARAGDAGRGFAVVADEVRKLAEKTMSSTTDVGNAIRAIQDSIAVSMRIMGTAVEEVERATVLAKQSGDAMQEIVGDIGQAAEQVTAIADASREQSAASEAINHTVERVNDMSAQTAQAMNEASGAIGELARQTQELSAIITEMKKG